MPIAVTPTKYEGYGLETKLERQARIAQEGVSIGSRLKIIIADVLKIDLGDLDEDKSFLSLGGDSLLAIKIMARCKANSIDLNVVDVVDAKSIADLCQRISPGASPAILNKPATSATEINQSANVKSPNGHLDDGQTISHKSMTRKAIQRDEKGIAGNVNIDERIAANFVGSLSRHAKPLDIIHSALARAACMITSNQTEETLFYDICQERPNTSSNHYFDTVSQFRTRFSPFKEDAQLVRKIRDCSRVTSQSLDVEAESQQEPYTLTPNSDSDTNIIIVDVRDLKLSQNGEDLSVGPVSQDAFSSPWIHEMNLEDSISLSVSLRSIENKISCSFLGSNRWQAHYDLDDFMNVFKASISGILRRLQNDVDHVKLKESTLLQTKSAELDLLNTITLDRILRPESRVIESVLPCSPIQEGFLISQSTNPALYQCCFVLTLSNHRGLPMDARQVGAAWKKVVKRHSILRTILVDSYTRPGHFDQVVLESFSPRIEYPNLDQRSSSSKFSSRDPVSFDTYDTHHRMQLAQPSSSEVHMKLEISHTLVDGQSTEVLLRDLSAAYLGTQFSGSVLPYGDFVSYQSQIPVEPSRTYWSEYLAAAQPSFLPMDRGHEPLSGLDTFSLKLDFNDGFLQEFCGIYGVTLSNVCQLAWGLVLRCFTGSDNVLFSHVSSGRSAPLQEIHNAVGPFVATLPCRIKFDNDTQIGEILKLISKESFEGISHRYTADLYNKFSSEKSTRQLGNTTMSFQRALNIGASPESAIEFAVIEKSNPTDYDIQVGIEAKRDELEIELDFWHSRIDSDHAHDILDTFREAIHCILSSPHGMISDISLLSVKDRSQLQIWNHDIPKGKYTCLHEQFAEVARQQPNAPAVCAWDGNLTYAELFIQAATLASYLVENLGVKPETMVAVCMDKSKYAIVAMLAILQAGGVVVPLGVSHPITRIEVILKDTQASIMLIDIGQAIRLAELAKPSLRLIAVDQTLLSSLSTCLDAPRTPVTPENAAWIIFTSGSTGIPKGVVLSHINLSTSIQAHAELFGVGRTTRAAQFAAYTFDVSISDIFSMLHYGGCICIFSENSRMNNLTQALQDFRVTYVNLTPTVIRLLDPTNLPLIKTAVVGGEPLDSEIVKRWSSNAQVFNSYGPSECAIISVCYGPVTDPNEASNVGFPTGTRLWVTQTSDWNQLCPIGATGELLVEGPMLSCGYLNDPKKTAKAFVENPAFMRSLDVQRGSRLYRTGDLVRQNRDGSLTHLGRHDTQVKIRGQRVEIGEIEHCITQNLQDVHSVMVLITNQGHERQQTRLVAVIQFKKDSSYLSTVPSDKPQDSFLPPTDRLYDAFAQLRSSLFATLPPYMVPNIYLPALEIPLNPSGKLDRRAMRDVVEAADIEEIQLYNRVEAKSAASTETEQLLQKLWAEILGIDVELVGVHDHFFQIGGDSVAAIRTVAAAREKSQLRMTVADILQHPQLSALAQFLDSQATNTSADENDAPPFSLWKAVSSQEKEDMSKQLDQVAAQCDVRTEQVEDVYPCTPLQEGLIAITSRQSTAYVSRRVFSLANSLDTARFKVAWQIMADSAPILRTRIIFGQQVDSFQVVVRDELVWQQSASLQTYLDEDRTTPMTHGQPLNKFGLIEQNSGERFFVWTAHHSTYDGWSMNLTLQQVADIYLHKTVPRPVPYTRFIRYLAQADLEATKNYWREQLKGSEIADFPPLPTPNYQPRPQKRIKQEIDLSGRTRSDVMISDVLRAAWALVSGQYADHKCSVFAVALSGRDAPVDEIASLVAPTITTVPLHVRTDREQTVQEFFKAIQEQRIGMIPHEHTGLQRIKQLVPDVAAALDLRHLFLVQPAAENETSLQIPGMEVVPVSSDEFDSYGLNIECTLGSTAVKIDVRFDEKMISTFQIERLLAQFAYVTQQLYDPSMLRRRVGDVDLVSPQDVHQIKEWNREIPPAINDCVQNQVAKITRQQPAASAVCSWDGDFTYNELTAQAATLAHQLIELGVGPEVMVCFCMDKSKWAIVAMLAILQAGGVVVPLGTAYPMKRIKGIINDTNTKIVLLDQKQADRLAPLAEVPPYPQLIAVDSTLLNSLPARNECPATTVMPENAAWVVYTSGSTGIPKGVVLQHQALCSSLHYLGARFGLGIHTRTIQFAAHTFDAVIQDCFATLVLGGTVCVPSEEDRMNNLTKVMQSMNVNFANFTSTVAKLLTPTELPTLRTMILAGEPVQTGVVETWYKHTDILNSYGPSECSINSTCNGPLTDPSQSSNIGFALGTRVWVTEATNPDRLCPIGIPGELLVEGPLLSRGYLNNAERTNAAFITDPAWTASPVLGLELGRRMYRTGDLVRQNNDGSLTYIGRRDNQIKIRGQRVEIGEIEYWIAKTLEHTRQVAVMVSHQGREQQTGLTAVVEFSEESAHHGLGAKNGFVTPSEGLRDDFKQLKASLLEVLPLYMVPSTYIPISQMPTNTSGKLDRRAVSSLVSTLSAEEMHRYAATKTAVDSATLTETEHQVQQLWAQTLGIDASLIGAYSHFFEMGGDSVTAMRIVVAARERQLRVTVAEIFEHPQLSKLAAVLEDRTRDKNTDAMDAEDMDVAPFELLDEALGLQTEDMEDLVDTIG